MIAIAENKIDNEYIKIDDTTSIKVSDLIDKDKCTEIPQALRERVLILPISMIKTKIYHKQKERIAESLFVYNQFPKWPNFSKMFAAARYTL